MPNQIFHFSNTGISSGQRFYLKDEVSGIFLNRLNINSDRSIQASNLVTNNLILQDNLLQSSQASGYLTGVGYSGNYDGGYFLGRTKLSQNTSRLVDSSFGNIWTPKDSNRAWRGVSISSDGKYQTAVAFNERIYVSNDYGNTWNPRDNFRKWTDVSISSDGKYQIAIDQATVPNGRIYVSSDYGNTWIVKDSARNWRRISISSDGKYQTAVVFNGQIYVSSDYGNTWTAKEANRGWWAISISSDGKYQTAGAYNGQIYISSDYGNSWLAKDSNRPWITSSISSDGKYQTAATSGAGIYVSSDYGNTWVAKETARSWNFVSISSDGKYQSAVVDTGQIYVSSDYGNTWTAKQTNRKWSCISISSDGKYQTATVGFIVDVGQIYISKTDEQIDGNLYVDNLYATTGFFSISGATALALPNNPLSVVGSGNSYVQVNIQNRASGTTATADLVITANNGTDSANFINLGINNSGYNDPTFSNGSGLDGYLFINGGSLDIGTQTANTNIEFHIGGTTLDKSIARITSDGLNIVSGGLTASNIVYNTGAQNISGAKTFFDSGIFSLSGASPLFLPNNPLSIVGSGNNYLQLNIQNRATGTDASADLVITANNGTDSSNYINLGINNSGYNNASYNNATGYDGYLFIDGGDLDIGTRTPGKIVEFHAGGTTESKVIARISESGLNIVSGGLTVSGINTALSTDVMNFLPKVKSSNTISIFAPGSQGSTTGPGTRNRRFSLIYLPSSGNITGMIAHTVNAPNNVNSHIALWNVGVNGLPGNILTGVTGSVGTTASGELTFPVNIDILGGFYYMSFTPELAMSASSLAAINHNIDSIYGSLFGKSSLTGAPLSPVYTATVFNQTNHETFSYSNSTIPNLGIRYRP
jgi:hypothetical protein